MTVTLVDRALNMAFDRRKAMLELSDHSDRGVHYRWQKYIDQLRRQGCRDSMSRQGNYWETVLMESFFSGLKVELVYTSDFKSIQEARSDIFSYIDLFTNKKEGIQ